MRSSHPTILIVAHCAEGFMEVAPAFSYRSLRLRTKSGKAEGVHAAENVEVRIQEVNHKAMAAGREARVRAWSPEGELAMTSISPPPDSADRVNRANKEIPQ